MIFNSFEFLWLFPLIFIVYYGITMRKKMAEKWPKIGNFILLLVSYGLYIKWKPVFALVLLGITAVTYYAGILLEKRTDKRKVIVWAGIVLALIPLILFKYYNFLSQSLEQGLALIGIQTGLPGLNWAMPLGISFYTLIAIGYVADVYLKRILAEHNWWDYMLFVSFFPALASGPISKAADLLPQIKAHRSFNYAQAVQGCKWLLWGMFLKVVVADELGMRVDLVYQSYNNYNGFTLFLTSIFYTFQIYCDFAGYSFMAIGVGQILGFDLINNFNRPYLSQTVTEFWHRWHISLSQWLRDYVYIPMGGSRCSKARNYWNIFITFLVSGIWHGANWTFIFWGVLHGVSQIMEKMLGLNKKKSNGVIKMARILITFLIVNFAWIFFRMPSFQDAFHVIGGIFSMHNLTTDAWTYWTLLIVIVMFKDIVDETGCKPLMLFHHKYTVVRWATYLLVAMAVAVLGVYGGQFIYSRF